MDLLDLVIALTVEAGTEFNRKFRNEVVGSGDAVFESLTRLHARARQVSGEVLALLHAGFADGAHALPGWQKQAADPFAETIEQRT